MAETCWLFAFPAPDIVLANKAATDMVFPDPKKSKSIKFKHKSKRHKLLTDKIKMARNSLHANFICRRKHFSYDLR